MKMHRLPRPARYFPLSGGRYEVAPGLKRLGLPLGNGEADARLFQIDTNFAVYRENELRCRAERLSKYYTTHNFSPQVASAVSRFIAARLHSEYNDLFRLQCQRDDSSVLHCRLTDEVLRFDAKMQLTNVEAAHVPAPAYASALDALCCQIPEDVAVVCTEPKQGDWIAALHLCSPSHWAAEDKIGQDFVAAHAAVPGFAHMNATAPSLLKSMVHKGPFVRFVWGIAPDTRLNCHPEPPPGRASRQEQGLEFGPCSDGSPFYLRVERQCLWGLPHTGAALFTIRISFLSGKEIRTEPRERALLRSALLSMSPESRVYKSVDTCIDQLLTWLDDGG
jgi:hypothetical protein